MQTVAGLVDRNRVLLVFAPSGQDPRVQTQIRLLSRHSAEMKERDLVLLPVFLQSGTPTGSDTLRELQPPPVSDAEQLALRRQYTIGQTDFAVVLLGKDGGEKFRSTTPVPVERLDQIIDAMPMRKNEMKQPRPK